MKLSIVIPVYNEEHNIDNTLKEVIEHVNKKYIDYEIIIADDGSTDRTRDVIKKYKNVVLTNKRINKGKGYSVKEGILMAKGDYILFTDADLSTPIEEVDKFMEFIKKYDIVIGSRALKESKVNNILYKKILGRIGNFFISFLLVKGIKDTQCGFKLFRKVIAKEIFKRQTINRWGFDFEIIHIAQKKGFKIKEQPVRWIKSRESKVRLIDYPKTLLELIKIKINDIKGAYR